FADLDTADDSLRTIDTIASYFPLIFPQLHKEKEEELVLNLKDPQKYNTLIPTPTVARDSSHFLKDMWRGPVWINTAYFTVKGLKNRGYTKLAGEFAYRLCKGVYKTWNNEGYFFEFYDPDRYDIRELYRKKGNLYKKITISSKPVKDFAGWTADVNALLIEDVIGLRKVKDTWFLEPHLPKQWFTQGNEIYVELPFYSIELTITVKNRTELEATVKQKGEQQSYICINHEAKILDSSFKGQSIGQ
ncbi:MAG: MGH1-like glycoside hydrolase domain-containing protein, partial [Promethearchaeia archaeon]